MDGNGRANVVRGERCPRCQVCGKVVRVRGVVPDVWCVGCLSGALPFVGLTSGGEFGGALREFREGLGSGAADFSGLRFDPYDEEVRGALEGRDWPLGGVNTPGGMLWGVG